MSFLGGIPVRSPEINIEYYLKDIEKTGGYVLVVEGALVEGPDNSGKYCLIGGETVKERVVKAANKAKVIITLGTCASCGGIPGDRRSESVVRDFPGLVFRGTSYHGSCKRIQKEKTFCCKRIYEIDRKDPGNACCGIPA